jgi:LacI family transcriptional regulator
MDRVRLSDVAKQAGVHTATASRALNPAARHEVNPDTVRRVEQAARKLGYVANTLARGLRTSRSFVVALVVPDITNALFPPIVRGAERMLSRAGYTLVLTDTNNDLATERSQVAAMRARGVDGFIVATARWSDQVVRELAASGIPTVLVNRRDSAGELPYIGGDDRHGMQLCVDHLAALGHRSILHLAGPNNTSTGRERTAAFRSALRAHGRSSAGAVIECTAYTEEAGAAATHELIARGTPFSALVAANDLIALGVIDALTEHGLRCPDDVSVTGYNNLSFVSRVNPPLTTVGVPLNLMGELAAEALLRWIGDADGHTPVQTLLPVEFVERATTATVALTARTAG